MSEQNINDVLCLVTSLLDSNNTQLTSNIKLVASVGWSIPLEIPYEQFNEICKDKRHQKNDINIFLEQFYLSNPNFIFSEFSDTIGLLSKYNAILFEQMKICFINGQYEICTNALFALIEGALLNFMGENRKPTQYNEEFIISLLKKGQYHFYEYPIHSLSALLNYYMQPIDFNSEQPNKINRHWTQHGRNKDISIEKTDVIKLILFLKLILLTALWLKENEEMISESKQQLLRHRSSFKNIKEKLDKLKCKPNK